MNIRARVLAFARALDEHDAPGAASAMAFHAFFSLMPLIALIGWSSHRVLRSNAGVLDAVLRFTPRSVATLADSELLRLSASGEAVLAPVSAVSFLWLASGGVAVAMKEFEKMLGAPPRRWLVRRAMALGFVLLAVLTVALGAMAALLSSWAGSAAARVAAMIVPFLALWLLVAGFFRLATARRVGVRGRGFLGAMVTIAAWVVVSATFSLYVREIANYSRFYGSLAAVAVLLVWLWLMALSLLVGAEVNARIEGSR